MQRDTRYKILASSLLIASAFLSSCDAINDVPENEPESLEERLVGRWFYRGVVSKRFLTVSSEQTILDPTRPGAGAIILSGAVSDTLRYLQLNFLAPEDPKLYAEATDVSVDSEGLAFDGNGLSTFPQPIILEYPLQSPSYVGLKIGADKSIFLPEGTAETISFDHQLRTLSAHNLALTNSDGETVTANGSLMSATRTVPAGSPSLFNIEVINVPRFRYYDFEMDGTYTYYECDRCINDFRKTSFGTWRVTDDGHVALSDTSNTENSITYRFSDNALIHSSRVDFCGDHPPYPSTTAECLAAHEQSNGVRAGTLTKVEFVNESMWTPSTEADSVTSR